MKKKVIVALVSMSISSLVFTGCGKSDKKESNNTIEEVDESDIDDSNESDDVEDSDSTKDGDASNFEVFQGSISSEEAADIIYTCYIRANGVGELYEEYKYSDNYKHTYYYSGTYEEVDGGYDITYSEDEAFTLFHVAIDGDTITSVDEKYDSVDYSEVAGSYSATTEEFGDVTITIDSEGNTEFVTEDATLSATIIYINDRWDIMVYDDYSGDYLLDWYIDLGDSTFTYEPYASATYSQYAGEYNMDGELGKIKVTVDENGNASCTVKVDGKNRLFEGSIYIYDEETDYGEKGFTLYSEDKYELSLSFEELDDETYSYVGTITIYLSYM